MSPVFQPPASGSSRGVLATPRVTFNTDISITATTEATSNTIVTAGSITANGTDEYVVIFYCAAVWAGAAVGAQTRIVLFDNGNPAFGAGVSTVANVINTAAGTVLSEPIYISVPIIPTAAAHVFDWRGFRVTSNGTVNGTQAGVVIPGFIEVRTA
jgi:hypothetical protein